MIGLKCKPNGMQEHEPSRGGEKKAGDAGRGQNARIRAERTPIFDLNNARIHSRWLPRFSAHEPGQSSFGKSAEGHVSLVGYVDPRMRFEQSSIIFEHCSRLFEFHSASVDHDTVAKPTRLGMVSSRALKLLE